MDGAYLKYTDPGNNSHRIYSYTDASNEKYIRVAPEMSDSMGNFIGPSAVYKAQNLESPIEGCDTAYVDTRGYGYWYIIRKNNEGGSEQGKIQVYGDDYLKWLTTEDHPLSFTEKAATGIENKDSQGNTESIVGKAGVEILFEDLVIGTPDNPLVEVETTNTNPSSFC